jgi:hypothetical protein
MKDVLKLIFRLIRRVFLVAPLLGDTRWLHHYEADRRRSKPCRGLVPTHRQSTIAVEREAFVMHEMNWRVFWESQVIYLALTAVLCFLELRLAKKCHARGKE